MQFNPVDISISVQEEISRCVNQLLLNEPFYAHILLGVRRKITTDIATASVSIDRNIIVLSVNPSFFLKKLKSLSQRVAVLKHETLHLVFKHLFRFHNYPDRHLYNIAADLVVNQYIGKWNLPADAVTLETFNWLKLAEAKTLDYYYKELKNQQTESNDNFLNICESTRKNYKHLSTGNHEDWSQKESSSEISEILLNEKLIDAYEKGISAGKTPLHPGISAHMESIKLSLKKTSNLIDWKRALRIFAQRGGRTKVHFSKKRISKRFGTRPGIKIINDRIIAAIVDTSASIDNETLLLFLNEINHLHKCGIRIKLIQADAEVSSIENYQPRKTEIEITGRGGTAFQPALNYANKENISGVIYFTDGYGDTTNLKSVHPLLWVISPNGVNIPDTAPGKKIRMRQ
jgi:predicted metal-dependent peptidase